MASAHIPPSVPTDPPTPIPNADEAPRGRLKRRRLPSHTPPRAPSPSRGHDRASGSRHRHHYRKHQRASSSPFIETPPAEKRNRRRSDAEPDHTFRGRGRLRSRSRSPVGDEGEGEGEDGEGRNVRKRSVVPSRGGAEEDGDELRRLRSYPNLYQQRSERFRGKEGEGGEEADGGVGARHAPSP